MKKDRNVVPSKNFLGGFFIISSRNVNVGYSVMLKKKLSKNVKKNAVFILFCLIND